MLGVVILELERALGVAVKSNCCCCCVVDVVGGMEAFWPRT